MTDYSLNAQPPTVQNAGGVEFVTTLKPHQRAVLERVAEKSLGREDLKEYAQAAAAGVPPDEVDKAKGAEKAMEFAQASQGMSDEAFDSLVERIKQKMNPAPSPTMPGLESPNAVQAALAALLAIQDPQHAYEIGAIPFQTQLAKQQQGFEQRIFDYQKQEKARESEVSGLQDELKMRNQRDIAELGADSRTEIAQIRADSQKQIADLNVALKQQGIDLQSLGLELKKRDFEEIKKPESQAKIAGMDAKTALTWARADELATLAPEKLNKLKAEIDSIKARTGYTGKQGELLDKKIANFDAEFKLRAANIYSQIAKRTSDANPKPGDDRKSTDQRVKDLKAMQSVINAQLQKMDDEASKASFLERASIQIQQAARIKELTNDLTAVEDEIARISYDRVGPVSSPALKGDFSPMPTNPKGGKGVKGHKVNAIDQAKAKGWKF